MKRWLKGALLLAGLGLGGFIVSASGIVSIKASSGHWAITALFLDFSKHRSVATHTIGLELPPLREEWLVLKGAGHYDFGCRPCHGAPDFKSPRIAQAMLPVPPDLTNTRDEYDPEELFYIIKHGIKLTGMPAWPAQQRDDEVWAVVAFLRELPNLDAAAYRRLVDGDVTAKEIGEPLPALTAGEPPRAIRTTCGRCHGLHGEGRGSAAFPALAGQKREYILRALHAYARGERHSGIMEPIAAGLTSQEIDQIAAYYSRLPIETPLQQALDAPAIERGRTLATQGIPAKRVPACEDCHGPGGIRRNAAYPHLAGQYADYLVLQLELFKQGQRGGSSYRHLMDPVASGLSAEEMRDVAAYFASLPRSARRDPDHQQDGSDGGDTNDR